MTRPAPTLRTVAPRLYRAQAGAVQVRRNAAFVRAWAAERGVDVHRYDLAPVPSACGTRLTALDAIDRELRA